MTNLSLENDLELVLSAMDYMPDDKEARLKLLATVISLLYV